MGPNTDADVMPLGGRQTHLVRAPRIIFGLQLTPSLPFSFSPPIFQVGFFFAGQQGRR
jgi:hypothetical protein